LRAERINSALRSEAPAIGEAQIAAAVVGGEQPRTSARNRLAPSPCNVAGPALRLAAEHEAAVIRRSRVLAGQGRHRADARPVLSAVRRCCRRRCWVFELEYTDADGRLLWRELLGLSNACRDIPARSRALLRDVMAVEGAVSQVLARQHQVRNAELERSLHRALALARAREQAIVDVAVARRARLAALLAQPGLFGRGATSSADQGLAADGLVRRCEAHLRQLEAAVTPVAAGRELRFALLGD
jgi:hypothetical protein